MNLFKKEPETKKVSDHNTKKPVQKWSSLDHEELFGFETSELEAEDFGPREMGVTSDLTFLTLSPEDFLGNEKLGDTTEFLAERGNLQDTSLDLKQEEMVDAFDSLEQVQIPETEYYDEEQDPYINESSNYEEQTYKSETIEEEEMYELFQEEEFQEEEFQEEDFQKEDIVTWDAQNELGEEGYAEAMMEEVPEVPKKKVHLLNEDDEYTWMERVMDKLQNMTKTDWLIVSLSAVIAVALIFIVSFSMANLAGGKAMPEDGIASIGMKMDELGIIGEVGLDSVAASATMRMSQTVETTMDEFLAESESNDRIGLKLNITSIDHDMKIKIVNAESDKMVAGFEFQVKVTDPKDKEEIYTDTDKDGCIKLEKIAAGKYRVELLENESLSQFLFSTMSISMTVKDGIDYVKVDVSDEIKKEADVNSKVEDTAVQQEAKQEVAPALQDTVEWVESSKVQVNSDASYAEIKIGDIKSPTSASKEASFRKVEGESISISTDCPAEMQVGNATEYSFQAVTTNAPSGYKVKWYVGGTFFQGVEYLSDNIFLTFGEAAGNVTLTAYLLAEDDTILAETSHSILIKEVAAQNKREATKQSGELSVAVGGTGTITCSENITETAVIWAWSSSNTSVATVQGIDGNATVTGVNAGTATITGAATLDGNAYHTITYTVNVTNSTAIAIDTTALTIASGKTGNLTVTASNLSNGAALSVDWSSSDSSVAKVEKGESDAGRSVATITAGAVTKNKSVTITAKAVVKKDGKKEVSQTFTCTVTVTPGEAANTTSILYTKKGDTVYTYKDGGYVTAVYADYYNSSLKFFTKKEKTEYKYTGWQTIDGNTYFFDKNGSKVTGEQVILGAKYSFDANGVLQTGGGAMGIDVSKWNGSINWNAVKSAGVSYAIIRCGYRGASTGVLVEDPYYRTNISGASSAGIKVGLYFFTQAVNEAEAVEEASMCLSLANGKGVSMPIFIDVESASNGRANNLSTAQRTAIINAFCRTISNGGYSAGVYANKTWLTSYIDTNQLGSYSIWLAQYAAKPTYSGRYQYWQYTSKGSISGISGYVDLDIKY